MPIRRLLAATSLVAATAAGLVLVDVSGASARLAQMTRPHPSTADGWVGDQPVGVDADLPAVAKLRPALHRALDEASADASSDGVALRVNSGWRSRSYQADLLRDAVRKYGSEAEARRWVMSPEKSAHVSGDAVDISPRPAAAWLERHGAAYGLCRVYANETWHFELRTRPGGECPALITNAAG